jgi:peptidoglycan hydrolase-like protein with peptidoglycan-binding domain
VEPIETTPPVAAAPTIDYSSARIETIEYGSAKYNQTTRQLSLPTTGRGTGGDPSKSRINVSNRRIEVDIAPERVIEIQRALIERKYLEGEPTGVYDDVTIEAMRQFQTKEQIDVTGYPTAHSLKRLGLTR